MLRETVRRDQLKTDLSSGAAGGRGGVRGGEEEGDVESNHHTKPTFGARQLTLATRPTSIT